MVARVGLSGWTECVTGGSELISTVHERPSIKVQIKAQQRINEMKHADTARAEVTRGDCSASIEVPVQEQSERAALEAHAAVLVSTWSSANPTLRLKLLALPTLLTDTQVMHGCWCVGITAVSQVTEALTTVTSCLRDSNGEESAVVSRAYKKSLLKLHPDKMPHADTWNKLVASQVFEALRAAYAKES